MALRVSPALEGFFIKCAAMEHRTMDQKWGISRFSLALPGDKLIDVLKDV